MLYNVNKQRLDGEKKTVNTTPTSNRAFIDLTLLVFVSFPTGISFPSLVFVFAPLDFQRAWGSDAFGEKIENKAHCEHCRAEPLVPYKYCTNTKYKPSWMQHYCQRKEAIQDLVVLWSLIATGDTTGVCLQGGESHWYGALISSLCFVFVLDWSFVFVSVSHVTLIHLCCIALSCIWVVLLCSVQWYLQS